MKLDGWADFAAWFLLKSSPEFLFLGDSYKPSSALGLKLPTWQDLGDTWNKASPWLLLGKVMGS